MYAALETSFDETGIAVCGLDGRGWHAVLSSQVELHAPYGGCVPELAARTHLSDLPQLWAGLPAGLAGQITHIGVTAGPGLPGCLLAGINFARGLALGLDVPLYGLNHLAGHIMSPFIPGEAATPVPQFPHLALLVSGGHTELYEVRGLTDIRLLGQTQDDAVGELLDKVSAMLGYGYPGGARLEQLALTYPGLGAECRYDGEFRLPVPMRESHDLNFSYSGLKTAVVRLVRDPHAPLDPADHPGLLACLFSVVLDSLWLKAAAALKQTGYGLLTVSGGVAINGFLRARFAAEASAVGVRLLVPEPRYCLDNAAMMAWLLKLLVDAGVTPEPFDMHSSWTPGEAA
jgi:N6-L-threonylcarbamoyladenine synthase